MKETMLYASYVLNTIILSGITGHYPMWLKILLGIGSGLITLLTLINQAATFWERAQKWHIIIIIRERYKKKK